MENLKSDNFTLNENPALSIFATTADQRFLLGPDLFLRTHYPMTLRYYSNNQITEIITENELLENMHVKYSTPGNRLWFLYGAPGTGKSELLKWLEVNINQKNQNEPKTIIRISRSELDILAIVKKFEHLVSENFHAEIIDNRWEEAKRKPRTIAKLVLLLSLEALLETDDLITALFYKLINPVQDYVERIFSITEDQSLEQTIELMSQETWDKIMQETSITIPIRFEQFRHQIITTFSQQMFDGISLPNTLRRISEDSTKNKNNRPILLVDDLVQSLNLFATDLLDYFLNLEDGNWDVIFGLTPAAFVDNNRNRELLHRISHLDTIDDRVEKLWLSDEAGLEAYNLNEENCQFFAELYLNEYRSFNNNLFKQAKFFPFSYEVLVRIFRGLPVGKGKVRYFLETLKEILGNLEEEKPLLEILKKYARTEYVAHSDNQELSLICELFGPILNKPTTKLVVLKKEILQAFSFPGEDISIKVEPLVKYSLPYFTNNEMIDDEEKVAIRDWLLRRDVNRQLLQRLRFGTTKFLRKIDNFDIISKKNSPKLHGILHWKKPFMASHPPIKIEGLENEPFGILLTREIGLAAFDLYNYANSTGKEAKFLEDKLANNQNLLPLLFEARNYQEEMCKLLEAQLGLDLEQFALSVYFSGYFLLGNEYDMNSFQIPKGQFACLELPKSSSISITQRLKDTCLTEITWLFEDFFKLRENVFDIPKFGLSKIDNIETYFIEKVLKIDTTNISSEFFWGKKQLTHFIKEYQTIINLAKSSQNSYQETSSEKDATKLLAKVKLNGIRLSELTENEFVYIKNTEREVAQNLYIIFMNTFGQI